MLQKSKQKVKLLTLIDIFNKKTDDDHPLTAVQLCEKLKEDGIIAERKSIYSDIEVLINYGIDINKAQNHKRGFYLATRNFELPEIRLLIDAVLSAPFITEKKTNELIQKLKSLLSDYQAEQISKQISNKSRVKCQNEEIYYNIDAIYRAIKSQKKVQFTYYHRRIINEEVSFDRGRKITVSPYDLLWANDKYYLIANNEQSMGISNYRLDRMKGIKVSKEDLILYDKVINDEKEFDILNYKKRSINIGYGQISTIELLCKKDFVDVIIDKFGTNISLYNKGGNGFLAIISTCLNEELIKWLVQNGDIIMVKSPEALRRRVLKKIKGINQVYRVQKPNNIIHNN